MKRIAVAALLTLAACSPGDAGPMSPVARDGVTIARSGGGDVARVGDGTVTAEMSGRWSSRGEQLLEVRFVNGGRVPARLAVNLFGLRRGSIAAPLIRVADTTGVNLADASTANDAPRILIGEDSPTGTAAALPLAPGETRTVEAAFASPGVGGPIVAGQHLGAAVPLPSGPRVVVFRTAMD